MAKKIKKSTSTMLLKWMFYLMVLLILGVLVIPFTPVPSGSPALWVDVHGFFVDVRTNLKEYATVFGLGLGTIGVLVFLFKKYIIK